MHWKSQESWQWEGSGKSSQEIAKQMLSGYVSILSVTYALPIEDHRAYYGHPI
jgi:hypothetical protein